jgi:hypothetical protein
MRIFVDIDGTICNTVGHDYLSSKPDQYAISTINNLYDQGNTIVYWTARGGTSGIDWRGLTEKQLKLWGCKYHELRMDKPSFDMYIDNDTHKINDLL